MSDEIGECKSCPSKKNEEQLKQETNARFIEELGKNKDNQKAFFIAVVIVSICFVFYFKWKTRKPILF